ncbi:MAG: hypothetical protein JW795_22595 [Chitinivibrionales bacterium]|nr:hypothetical protein [Chitinivibrionales bacterium]
MNAINDYDFAPWCREVASDVKWGKYTIEFKEMMTLRDKPKTYHVILARCEPLNAGDPKTSWGEIGHGRNRKSFLLIVLKPIINHSPIHMQTFCNHCR